MRSDDTTTNDTPDEPVRFPAQEELRRFAEFRRAGEALAADFERDGLATKAGALRGAMVILGNDVIDSPRLADPAYTAAILALHDIAG